MANFVPPKYVIGTITLGDRAQGYGLLSGTRVWGSRPGNQVTQVTMPGRAGVVVPDKESPAGPRTLALKVRVIGNSHQDLHQKLSALYTQLLANKQITRIVDGLPNMRTDFVLLQDIDWPDPYWNLTQVNLDINLLMTEGVWKELSSTQQVVGTTPTSWNIGDAPIYDAIITFPASTNPFIEDMSSGARVSINAVLNQETSISLASWSGHSHLDFSPIRWRETPGGQVRSGIDGVKVTHIKRWYA